jgi:tetratricopeptide (TPR) repeat protein
MDDQQVGLCQFILINCQGVPLRKTGDIFLVTICVYRFSFVLFWLPKLTIEIMDRIFEVSKLKVRILLLKRIVFIFLTLCLFSCNKGIEEKFNKLNTGSVKPFGITVNYPQNGTIFPPEIPAPEFSWKDTLSGQNKYHISISTDKGEKFFTQTVNTLNWRPDSLVWKAIKSSSNHENVFFTIVGESSGILNKKYSSGKISFSFSPDSIGAPVFYRAVPLPFSYAVKNVREIEWYLGRVNGEKPLKILDNLPVCANCHSFSKDGSQFAMDIDYANDKGSYIISSIEDTIELTFEKIITWSDYKREDGDKTFGLLSQISPDGKYVLSTVKDRSIFVPVDNLEYSQLFFPIKGILAVYDREKKKFYELPGACNKFLVQSNPNWSPDGKEIMFTRASRYYSEKVENSMGVLIKPEDAIEFTSRQKDFKFDLYRLDFNEGNGGVAIPVPGASDNGASNYFARYSPDGKWIIFCQAKNFMLLMPDSKLYIMPAKGGIPRLMNCNMSKMNSWHSWSPNGKWVVFSSKNKGPYTQLYLTHIDEQGNDSPAVLLENLIFSKKAANIPEFLDNRKYNLRKMKDSFSQSAIYYTSLAARNFENDDLKSALSNLEKAIKTDSTFVDAYINRIIVNMRLGQTGTKNFMKDKKIAIQLINKQLQQKPNDPINILKRGKLEYSMGEYEAALRDGLAVVKMNPENFDSYFFLASIYQKTGEMQKTLACYEKMLKLRPGDQQTTYYMGLLYQNTGRTDQAYRVFSELINKYPTDVNFYFSRANLLYMKGDIVGTKSDLDKAVLLNPTNWEVFLKRGLFWSETGQKDMAEIDLKKALPLLTAYMNKNPENVALLAVRPEILEKIGDLDGALADYEKYLTLRPMNYKALKQKARIEFSLKRWKKSLETLTSLIDNYPPEPVFFSNRSFANLQLGNRSQALADLKKAQNLLPNDYSILYELAILKRTMGDNLGAKKDFEKIASLLSEKKKKGRLNNAETKLLFMISEELKHTN